MKWLPAANYLNNSRLVIWDSVIFWRHHHHCHHHYHNDRDRHHYRHYHRHLKLSSSALLLLLFIINYYYYHYRHLHYHPCHRNRRHSTEDITVIFILEQEERTREFNLPFFYPWITWHFEQRFKFAVFVFVCVGKQVHTMVAHLDAVTSLAVDPNGLYLLSGSKHSTSWSKSHSYCRFSPLVTDSYRGSVREIHTLLPVVDHSTAVHLLGVRLIRDCYDRKQNIP